MANSSLRLVYSRERNKDRYDVLHDPQTMAQGSLFPEVQKEVLIFLCFPEVTDIDFKTVLERTLPSLVFELRPVPRFDIGKLNRQRAFEWFHSHGIRYIELTPADGTAFSWDQILDGLRQIRAGIDIESRPVMFLVNGGDLTDRHIRGITSALQRNDRRPWRVCEVPQFRYLELAP